MTHARFVVGRWFLVVGLAVLPDGRVKRELSAMVKAWGTKVYAEVWLERLRKDGDEAMVRLLKEIAQHEAKANL